MNEIKFLVLVLLQVHPMFVGMDGGITLEICNGELVCCNSGKLDSPRYINIIIETLSQLKINTTADILCFIRNDFHKGMYDVFAGSQIGECDGIDLGDGNMVMVVTHNGPDAWLGEWIRSLLLSYN